MLYYTQARFIIFYNKFAFTDECEALQTFIPITFNQRKLIGKIEAAMEERALDEAHYGKTAALLSRIEQYFDDLALDFPCELAYTKCTIASLLHAAGIEVPDDSVSLAERFLHYMELVREFDRDKLFITVNMRAYVEDAQMQLFLQTVRSHGFHLLMIESFSYPLLPEENRRTVDEDLCEF